MHEKHLLELPNCACGLFAWYLSNRNIELFINKMKPLYADYLYLPHICAIIRKINIIRKYS